MRVLKKILGFLFSRFLWTLIGIVVLCALIWFMGPLVSVGDVQPLEPDLTRLIVISVIVILWLVSMLRQMRAPPPTASLSPNWPPRRPPPRRAGKPGRGADQVPGHS